VRVYVAFDSFAIWTLWNARFGGQLQPKDETSGASWAAWLLKWRLVNLPVQRNKSVFFFPRLQSRVCYLNLDPTVESNSAPPKMHPYSPHSHCQTVLVFGCYEMFEFCQRIWTNQMGICVRFQKYSELGPDPALRFFRNKYPLDVWFRHSEAWWNLKSMVPYGARDNVDTSLICSDSQKTPRIFDILASQGARLQACKSATNFSYRQSAVGCHCVFSEAMCFGQQVTVIKILPIIGRWMTRLDIKQCLMKPSHCVIFAFEIATICQHVDGRR
jgi:hypothetical protein